MKVNIKELIEEKRKQKKEMFEMARKSEINNAGNVTQELSSLEKKLTVYEKEDKKK